MRTKTTLSLLVVIAIAIGAYLIYLLVGKAPAENAVHPVSFGEQQYQVSDYKVGDNGSTFIGKGAPIEIKK